MKYKDYKLIQEELTHEEESEYGFTWDQLQEVKDSLYYHFFGPCEEE